MYKKIPIKLAYEVLRMDIYYASAFGINGVKFLMIKPI